MHFLQYQESLTELFDKEKAALFAETGITAEICDVGDVYLRNRRNASRANPPASKPSVPGSGIPGDAN